MSFDYVKFVRENQLTSTSRLKARFNEEDETSAAAGKAHANNAQKLQQLIKQKDEILADYKSGNISLDQYKTKIGNIPQQIKQLRLDLDAELNPAAGEDEEGGENMVTAPAGSGDKDADVSGVEAGALQTMAGGTQYPDDMEDGEETAPSRIDMDYYQGDQDEIQEAGPAVPPLPSKKPAVPPAPKAVDKINFQSVNSGDISDAASFAYTLYNIATKLKGGEKFNPESDQNIKTALQLLRKAAKLAPAAPELPKK